jgi:hypothetical protein
LLKLLKTLTAVAPAAVFLIVVLNSRIRLHQQFDEWILPDVWMFDLTVWLLAPLIYILPSFEKGSRIENLKLIYWIAFGVLTFIYGSVFVFLSIEAIFL